MQHISSLAALTALTLTTATPVLAEPEVSDPGSVAQLVAAVAQAEQKLHDVGATIEARQEAVNKAIAEVQQARDAGSEAERQVVESQAALDGSTTAVAAVQHRVDEYAAAVYVHGPDFMTDMTVTQTLAISSHQLVSDVQRARTEQANLQSAARGARQRAEQSVAAAQQSLDAAAAELTAAQADLVAKRSEVGALVAQRDAARAGLATTGGIQNNPELDYVPEVPPALLSGDPKAAIIEVLRMSAGSARATGDMGRQFMADIGLPATSDTGLTNGRIPAGAGHRASEQVIRRAVGQIGVPYSWGGGYASGPTTGIREGAHTVGFDCSGLILYAFAGVGILLPHYSGFQYETGRKIPAAQMRRGDVIFYGPGGSQHVALYLGDGQMLEAPNTGQLVRISRVRTSGMTPYAVRYIEY